MKPKHILIFLIILASSFTTKSQQLKQFDKDTASFFVQLTKFFQDIDNSDDKKTAKEFMVKFTPEWRGGKFSDEQKKDMITTCNLMLKKKMKAIPNFRNYLSAIMSFNNTSQTPESFKAWQASLAKLISKSSSTLFVDYLDISNNLFTNNVLYLSSTTKWKSDNSDYTFEYDTIPRIVFSSLDLTCYANNDSAIINNTKGIYYPTLGKWTGQGGKVLWVRAGFDEKTVYAELNKYTISVKFSKYKADSVKFYYTSFFDKPLLGVLEDKILANQDEDKASYPRFDSYDKRLKIESIFPDIDYVGGFSMHGGKLFGSGNADQDAYLYFYRDKKLFIRTGAKMYIIRKDKISSENASVAIYWEKDSITHPGLQLRYMKDTKELSLQRGDKGIAQTPFFDTYHKLDMYIEAVNWKMDEPLINLKMIQGEGTESEALFESYNFFSAARYYKMQGIDETHPLGDLNKYSKLKDTNVISVPEYARYLKIAEPQIVAMMLKLSNMGFISYDIENNKVYIKEKLLNFLLSRAGKIDYDVIQFNSVTRNENNATLSLLNFDLKLNGVSRVFLSDSQSVYIYPKDKKITVKKNRDFEFDGLIHAGMFDFYGKLFSFSYLKFNIGMPVIDSMAFYVRGKTRDAYGKYNLEKVKSVIEGIKGDLQIDAPNNKSGVLSIGKYPIFSSLKDSYVYYDKRSIQHGVYDRSAFYFHLDPFQIDSLDNISTEGIGFTGNFVSADIFPAFDEVLKVQPDYSLGFVRTTPESGFAAYKGKGTYDSIVDLSNKGLRGRGTLNYLTSVTKSNAFVFFPDSTNSSVQTFRIKEQKTGVEYPSVAATDVYEHWAPYNDLMIVKSLAKPIQMYDTLAKLTGHLALAPTGLTGKGVLDFKDAEMDADLYKFKNRKIDSDTANFRLKSYDLAEFSFSTHNYNAHIDFDARKGDFKSNGGSSKVEFLENMYICFMDQFTWFMDKEEIELANTTSQNTKKLENLTLKQLADIDISGSEFVSVHPAQDSLRFYSPKAKFNLRTNIIYAQDVKIIKVADAAIYPDKGEVTILKKAEMKPLINAKILANVTTQYHTMYNALVNIQSRKSYTANGMYDYTDENEKKFPIYMSTIAVDTTLQSYGNGVIPDTSKFMLSPNFAYTGKVKMEASKEFLYFNGAFRIKQNCDTLYRNWVKFKSEINPAEIYIPLTDTIRTIGNSRLEAGTFLAKDSIRVYSAFLTKKIHPSDQNIVSARGFIYYDNTTDEYRISNKEKLKQLNLPGNYVSLTKESCVVVGDGKIDLAPNTGRMTVATYGNVTTNLIRKDSVDLDVVMAIDFFFNDDAFKLMTQDLEKQTTLAGVNLSGVTFTKSLTEILGVKEADKVISDISLNGAMKKVPDELQHTMLLSNIEMTYDRKNDFFVSSGPIGIVSLNKTQLNKYVSGYITVKKATSGDEINIYLKVDDNDWYYFNFKGALMQAFSFSKEFNQAIINEKPDKRTLKAEKDKPQYSYTISTETKKKIWLKKVEPTDTNKDNDH